MGGVGMQLWIIPLLLKLLPFIAQPHQFGNAMQCLLQNRACGGMQLLSQGADTYCFQSCYLAGIALFDPFDHAQQGGFAAAIGTDQADFFAGVDGQIGFVQQGLRSKAFTNFFQQNHDALRSKA